MPIRKFLSKVWWKTTWFFTQKIPSYNCQSAEATKGIQAQIKNYFNVKYYDIFLYFFEKFFFPWIKTDNTMVLLAHSGNGGLRTVSCHTQGSPQGCLSALWGIICSLLKVKEP